MLHIPLFPLHPLRKIFIICLSLSLGFLMNLPTANAQYPAGSPVAINGKLKVIGPYLTNECGNPVQLRGMATHGVQWFQNCYNTSALDALTNTWKIDILRLTMYIQEGGYLNDPAYWKTWIDKMVDECGKRGIYVVIDWHVHLPGDPFAAIDQARDFWTYMSKKHTGKKHVLYEICNEPNNVVWGVVQNYANDIIPRIRVNDPTTVIICGSSTWSQDVDVAANNPLVYPNLVYSLHFYAGSHGQALRDKGNYAISKGLALMVTEFGTSDAQNTKPMFLTESQQWMDWLNENKISWMNWSFADKDEPNSALRPGACGSSGWNNTTTSGAWIKEKLINPAKNFLCDPSNPYKPPVTFSAAFNGVPFSIPGKIEGEFYDNGGNTVGYYDVTPGSPGSPLRSNDVDIVNSVDVGAGYDIGWIDAGEWLNFSSTVTTAGKYDISVRVSVQSTGKTFHIESNNTNITGSIPLPATGDYTNYQTVKIPNVNLPAGDQVLKIVFETGGLNFNWMEIQPASTTGNQSPTISFISPINGSSFVAPAGISLTSKAEDADGAVVKVEYKNGTQVLGSSTTSPFLLLWNAETPGTYSISATATDNSGASTISLPITVVIANPVTQTSEPYSGTAAAVPGKIEAEHYDKGGLNIGYFDNSSGNTGGGFRTDDVDMEACTDVNGGYNVGWTKPGEWLQYTINVTATGKYDFNLRVATASSGKTLHLAVNNEVITANTLVPVTGGWQTWQTLTFPEIALTAGIQKLRIYFDSDDINLNSLEVSPSTGTPVNLPPVVSIATPLNGAVFTAPANITINANATDSDGSISKVEFLNGNTILGESLSSPFTFAWTSIAAGNYQITVKATDNKGSISISPAVSIIVNPAVGNISPQISITSPANGASFTAPASLNIITSSSDADGTISKVEFLSNDKIIGEVISVPFNFLWTNVTAGLYTLTTRATDNKGAVTTSAPVNIEVKTTVIPNGCSPINIPTASQWIVRNDWNDQTNGSKVSNTTDALLVTHRQWGRNKLWVMQTGKTFNIVKGQSYTVKFDVNNDVSNPVSSMDIGFATASQWDGPVLAQPITNTGTGFSAGSYSNKSFTIISNYTGTVNLVLGFNWGTQPNKLVQVYLKNVGICNASGTALRAAEAESNETYSIYPNPFEVNTSLKINAEEFTPMEVSITDLSGKEVFRSAAYTTNEEIILGEALSKGSYIVKVRYGYKNLVFNLIKI